MTDKEKLLWELYEAVDALKLTKERYKAAKEMVVNIEEDRDVECIDCDVCIFNEGVLDCNEIELDDTPGVRLKLLKRYIVNYLKVNDDNDVLMSTTNLRSDVWRQKDGKLKDVYSMDYNHKWNVINFLFNYVAMASFPSEVYDTEAADRASVYYRAYNKPYLEKVLRRLIRIYSPIGSTVNRFQKIVASKTFAFLENKYGSEQVHTEKCLHTHTEITPNTQALMRAWKRKWIWPAKAVADAASQVPKHQNGKEGEIVANIRLPPGMDEEEHRFDFSGYENKPRYKVPKRPKFNL